MEHNPIQIGRCDLPGNTVDPSASALLRSVRGKLVPIISIFILIVTIDHQENASLKVNLRKSMIHGGKFNALRTNPA